MSWTKTLYTEIESNEPLEGFLSQVEYLSSIKEFDLRKLVIYEKSEIDDYILEYVEIKEITGDLLSFKKFIDSRKMSHKKEDFIYMCEFGCHRWVKKYTSYDSNDGTYVLDNLLGKFVMYDNMEHYRKAFGRVEVNAEFRFCDYKLYYNKTNDYSNDNLELLINEVRLILGAENLKYALLAQESIPNELNEVSMLVFKGDGDAKKSLSELTGLNIDSIQDIEEQVGKTDFLSIDMKNKVYVIRENQFGMGLAKMEE